MAANSEGGIVKAIDVNTVHQICSGQVVLTLAVAVKELVENSLDSGATAVEVRLKNYGSEMVEVSDNGQGISETNFENLCLKHYTSKLQEFEDLPNVETFGFRGEALSSLCALSKLSVSTCEKGQAIGSKLEYDSHGKLVSCVKHSRQSGTTVTLCNLFYSLPVRHKEFGRNLKREFSKMVNTLTGYGLISKGTRITCTNITANGKVTTVLSTRGGTDLKDNITLIFGLKTVRKLLSHINVQETNLYLTQRHPMNHLESNRISSVKHIQFQTMLEIKTVQPSENSLLEFNLNEETVRKMNEPFQLEGFISSCSHGQGRSCADRQFYFINGRPCDPSKVMKLVNEIYHSYNRNQYPCIVLNITTHLHQVDINVTPDKRQLMLINEKLLLATIKTSLMELYVHVPSTFSLQNTSIASRPSMETTESPPTQPSLRSSLAAFAATRSKFSSTNTMVAEKRKLLASSPAPKQKRLDQYIVTSQSEPIKRETAPEVIFLKPDDDIAHAEEVHVIETMEELNSILDEITPAQLEEHKEVKEKEPIPSKPESVQSTSNRNVECATKAVHSKLRLTVPFSLDLLRQMKDDVDSESSDSKDLKQFLARINPDDTAVAEAELSRQISQHDFAKMEVVGQFNLGFIIAQLNQDLFIVDQHAADEKHNFETLQRTTQLKPQNLVCPRPLHLTAVNEALLIENIEIFRSNGFEFLIQSQEEATRRVSLTAVPMSGNCLLGPSDVDELLFMLQDSPVHMETPNEVNPVLMAQYRPSRVRAMFASRACRRAVMVGHSLTPKLMKKLLNQLGQLQQPWNCPHGRPTMRHLINLSILP